MTSMETAVAGTDIVTNVNRVDTPNLTMKNVELRKESGTVGTGTNSPDTLPQDHVIPFETRTERAAIKVNTQEQECMSLQPDNVAVMKDADVISGTFDSNLVHVSNTVPLVANDGNIHDQAVVSFEAPNHVTNDTNNAVQNVNNDVSSRREIETYLEVSEQQSKSGTLYTVDSVSLDSAGQGQSKNVSNARELNLQMEVKNGAYDGGIDANFQVGSNTVHGTEALTNKKGHEISKSKDSEKAGEYNDSEKLTVPCCDSLKNNSDFNDNRRDDDHDVESGKICEVELPEVPVMVHQASQTDLEECIEDSDGLRFFSVPQKPVFMAPAVVSKPATVVSAVSKTVATSRSLVGLPRVGTRATSFIPSVRPQPSVRPAYAAVSRLSSPANTRNQALSHTGPAAPRPYSSPRLVRSRTSTDVRPAGRGSTLRKLATDQTAAVLKSQRSTLVSRQVRNPV
jgi:hypothetical protein